MDNFYKLEFSNIINLVDVEIYSLELNTFEILFNFVMNYE